MSISNPAHPASHLYLFGWLALASCAATSRVDDWPPHIYVPCATPGARCDTLSDEKSEHEAQCIIPRSGLPAVCLPSSGLAIDETETERDACPPLPGPYTQKRYHNVHCVIECDADASEELDPDSPMRSCPAAIPYCVDNPFGRASRYEASRFCAAGEID